jgi:hypothetical protein
VVRQHTLIPGWSTEDSANAASQGWSLVDVYDLAKKTLSYQILPLQPANAPQTLRFVIARAQAGDTIARKALSFITQGKHEHRQKK